MSAVRAAIGLAFVLAAGGPLAAQGAGAGTGGTAALHQAERMLGHTKRVLMIAAHPDDEDTELLTVLVRGEGAEAAYLSLSRGEGGQNLIGDELGEDLGLLRSEELLAARRLDGARQYFTRAFDFGFSKTLDEAFRFWPADSLLKDVVRIVRRFRPQIIVSVFSGTPRDGHGQHQAAGWAAREAFRAAGDPARFPELEREEGLLPWTPVKLFRSARFDNTAAATVFLEGGVLDPDIGQSYRQVAMRGRSLHRSQDMGVLQEVGPSRIGLALLEDRSGQDAGENGGLWSGIDTSRVEAAGGIETEDARRHRADADAIRAGLVLDAWASAGRLVPGQRVDLHLVAWNGGAGAVAVRLEPVLPDGWSAEPSSCPSRPALGSGAVTECTLRVTVGEGAAVSTPYFLRAPRDVAMYRWTGDPRIRGEPFEPPLLSARFHFRASGGEERTLEREVVHRYRDQAMGEVRRPLAVVPRVAVALTPATLVWPIGERRSRRLTVTLQHAGQDTTRGEVRLELPPGWPPTPPQPFVLSRDEERESVQFSVRPPARLRAGSYEIRAVARDDRGRRYDLGVTTIEYPHVRSRTVARPARVEVRAAAIALPLLARIGYVRGAADRVPEALTSLGLPVELLDAPALERGELSGFDAIVIGSRAYETEPALLENNARLLQYVSGGGRLLVQYQQQPYFRGGYAPRPLSLAARLDSEAGRARPARVSDETAPVRLLDSASALFRQPNRIGPADWSGWVQERGLYFAGSWDSAWRPLLEWADPGEEPQQGGLLVLGHGRGTYVYTGIAFFRQLPAGVPGAVRLFLNLLAYRAPAPPR